MSSSERRLFVQEPSLIWPGLMSAKLAMHSSLVALSAHQHGELPEKFLHGVYLNSSTVFDCHCAGSVQFQ